MKKIGEFKLVFLILLILSANIILGNKIDLSISLAKEDRFGRISKIQTKPDNTFLIGELLIIEYVFTYQEDANSFQTPVLDNDFDIIYDSDFQRSGRFQDKMIINGKIIKDESGFKTTRQIVVKPKNSGNIWIEPASMNINGKNIKSSRIKTKVIDCDKKSKYNEEAFISTEVPKNFYVGQTAALISKVNIPFNKQNSYRFSQINTNDIKNFSSKLVESDNLWKRRISNQCVITSSKIIDHRLIRPYTEGKSTINQGVSSVRINNIRNRKNYNLESKKIDLNIKKIPRPFPENFHSKIVSKRLNVDSRVSRNQIPTGEALKYTIVFNGNNVHLIDTFPINFPNEFEIINTEIEDNYQEFNNSISGEKKINYILLPTKEGVYNIPSISFNYFHPTQDKFLEIQTQNHELNISKGKNIINDTNQISNSFIIFQKTSLVKIKDRYRLFLIYKFIFWIVTIISLIYILYRYLVKKKIINTNIDQKKRADKIANARLKEAKSHLENKNYDQFFEEIEKSLWGYFSDKFNVKTSEISKEKIQNLFIKYNINQNLMNDFILIMNSCESARYSKSKDMKNAIKQTLEKTKSVIINLESIMK